MKNRPITARVKSGMFKTKEPLLNVGPAGVDGNNTTRTMPSPSKMKGYTMKSSPFKETDAERNVSEALGREFDGKGGSKGTRETTTIKKGKEGTPDVITKPTETFTGEKATGAAAEKWAKQNEYCKGKPKGTPGCSGFHKYEGGAIEKGEDATPDEVVKTKVKGDTFRKQEGEASTAYATRNNLRKAKVAARNAKKYQRKADRAARREDDTLSAKDQRRTRKETAAASIKEVADSEMLNAQTQSAQGKSGFGTSKTTRLEDVVETAADSDTATQIAGLVDSPAEMNKPGFFKKKSPMKMNYFKK